MIVPGLISAWNLLIMKNFFAQIPESLIESATIDGARPLTVLARIVFPLSLPTFATIGLFYSVGHWNAWFDATIYINDSKLMPVQVLLRRIVLSFSNQDLDAEMLNGVAHKPTAQSLRGAMIVVTTLPILFVYPFLQKHFVKGVLTGSLKGWNQPREWRNMEQLGTIVLDLRPGPGNPRNSEGAFLELKDGRLMFAYSRFTGDSADDTAKACIAVRYSSDGGDSWTGDAVIAQPEDHDALNIMSVSLLRMRNGDIGLFYLLRYGWHDMRLHVRRSSDEGATWGEPVCCVPAMGYYVTNNDRVVRLSSGRLVVPAGYHRMKTGNTEWGKFDSRAVAFFFLSDDDGATWREARNFVSIGSPNSRSDMQEPGLIELANGTLWGWARTDLGCQYETFSHDGGESWSAPMPSAFTSPCSPLSMKRNPLNGELLAVWNPIPDYNTRKLEKHSWGRTPLIGAVSKDEGRTWSGHFAVEREEDGNGCCYVAIHFTGSAVLLAYCAGEAEDGICLTRLKVRKIALSELQGR